MTPAGAEVVQPDRSPQEMAESYAKTVSDAAALVFAYLRDHPEDTALDLDRNGRTATLYQAVAGVHPVIHDFGLTPTMWNRALSIALNALREQALAGTASPPTTRATESQI